LNTGSRMRWSICLNACCRPWGSPGQCLFRQSFYSGSEVHMGIFITYFDLIYKDFPVFYEIGVVEAR